MISLDLSLRTSEDTVEDELYPFHLYRILDGESHPSVPLFIDLSMQLGVDPLRVLLDAFEEGERTWPGVASSLAPCADPWTFALEVREHLGAVRHPERAAALDAFIADASRYDLGALMRAERTIPISLDSDFPLRMARARVLRDERAAAARRALSERFDRALDAAIDAGGVQSLSDVAESLGVDLSALERYSPERYARLSALRQSLWASEAPGVRNACAAALKSALAIAEGPALHEVARSLGLDDSVLLRACPEAYRALVDLRERERQTRHGRCREALERELRSEQPRDAQSLAAALGICPATLKRSSPRLYARLVRLPSGAPPRSVVAGAGSPLRANGGSRRNASAWSERFNAKFVVRARALRALWRASAECRSRISLIFVPRSMRGSSRPIARRGCCLAPRRSSPCAVRLRLSPRSRGCARSSRLRPRTG